MQNLGLERILGVKTSSTVQCRVSSTPGGAGTVYTVQIDENGQVVNTPPYPGNLNYSNWATSNYSVNDITSICPSVSYPGGSITQYGAMLGVTTDATGIFEFSDLAFGTGGVVVICALLAAGIDFAKRAIGAVNEETSDNDPLEWYIGPDGKEYWRMKASVKRRTGYE